MYTPTFVEYLEPCIDPQEDDSTDARRQVIDDFFGKAPVATKSDAVAFLKHHYPDISGGGHRGFIQREFPDGEPWEDTEKSCPKCARVERGNDAIQEAFGIRKSNGRIIAQSWCGDCR